ncbi:MAG TPA: hypothetical protein VFK41_02030 [Nocardioidaceae bacterium]|nr:hypothetical protein [Nocardioidaceae bacterium]
MSSRRFYRRRFLNKRGHHAGAYVLADCSIETYQSVAEVAASLTIADCGRVATLNFDVRSESDAGNALYKARLLRDVVGDFVVALEESVEEWRRRQGRPSK